EDAALVDQLLLLLGPRQARQRPLRKQDLLRVRIECHGEAAQPEDAGAVDHLAQQHLMTEMHAIEVADGDDRGGGHASTIRGRRTSASAPARQINWPAGSHTQTSGAAAIRSGTDWPSASREAWSASTW